MDDPSKEHKPPLKLDYGTPRAEARNAFSVFFTVGTGFVIGIFAVGCVGFTVFSASPPGSSRWARWIAAGLFGIVGFGALGLSLLLLRGQRTRPIDLDNPFFAGFLMGAAMSLLVAGACYAAGLRE
jgi:hypothetical protein